MNIQFLRINGVDRTELILSTGGHEQDVKAMLEFYGDLIETSGVRIGLGATHITDVAATNDPQSERRVDNEPLNDLQKRAEDENEPLNGPQKLMEAVRMNPKITKAALSDVLGVSPSTIKRWLQANNVVWVGHSKNGHWEIRSIDKT